MAMKRTVSSFIRKKGYLDIQCGNFSVSVLNSLSRGPPVKIHPAGERRIRYPVVSNQQSVATASATNLFGASGQAVATDCWLGTYTGYRIRRLAGRMDLDRRSTREAVQHHQAQFPANWNPNILFSGGRRFFQWPFLWPWDRNFRGPEAALLHLNMLDSFINQCAVREQGEN